MRPPPQFTTILIADDEPQHFLINSLTTQYGYRVVEQAFNLPQAVDLLRKHRPDVVLSDYYFKRSSRETERPDKAVGNRFIRQALSDPYYEGKTPKKPIILVTSKATLRAPTEILVGAINCSGANRATDPAYIHGVIWAEAMKRGAEIPNEAAGTEPAPEDDARHRLGQYAEDLPQLIRQWEAFEVTVRDTLRLCRLLSQSAENDDPEIVRRAVGLLEPYESAGVRSLSSVRELFEQTDELHAAARAGGPARAKAAIRNVLHGKVEQFSQVSNAVKFAITTIGGVAAALSAIPKYENLGRRLARVLENFSESDPLPPFLASLKDAVDEVLSALPAPPPKGQRAPRPPRRGAPTKSGF